MDGRRFDSLTTAFARRRTRRSALRDTGTGLAALLGGVAGLRGAQAQEATPTATPDSGGPTLLFVQTATGGRFSFNPQAATPAVDGTPTVGGGAEYLLTLEGHNGNTIYFSDRPDRLFGDWPTQQFFDRLGFTPAFPPNAALVAQMDDDPEDEVIILELVEPTYDDATGTLTYGANVLGGYIGEPLTAIVADQAAEVVPETFGRASLFIDEYQQASDCQITSCEYWVTNHGTRSFSIPGGPYAGYFQNAVDRDLFAACQPLPEQRAQLNAICSEAAQCPGYCVPSNWPVELD